MRNRLRPGEWAPLLLAALLFSIPFSIAAVEILFTVMLVVWGAEKVMRRSSLFGPFSRNQRSALIALLVYTLICEASIAWSGYPKLSIEAWIGKTSEYSLMFLIAAELSLEPRAVQRNLSAIRTACWLVLCYSLLQELSIYNPWHNGLPVDPIRGTPLNYMRMVGPYKNPNDLATFLMVAALLFLADRSSRLLAFLLTFCLAWTKSLGALLGFSVGAGLLALRGIRRRKTLAVLGGGLLLLFALYLALDPHIKEILTLSDIASRDRLTMWRTGWKMSMDHPWLGHGLNTFMANYQRYAPDPEHSPSYAHNCFLQIIAETGVVGLLSFLAFLAAFFFSAATALFGRKATPKEAAGPESSRWILGGLVAGAAAYLVQSFFDTNLYSMRQASLFWSLGGVALGLCHPDARRRSP